MVFLNTYWTWSYFLMLLFVFWTLIKAQIFLRKYQRDTDNDTVRVQLWIIFYRLLWPALGTYFFHCIW